MPNAILEWGISVIAAIQTVRSPMLDQFFIGISDLGSAYFYFAALPIICTMVNRKIGIRIALAILFSVLINSILKFIVGEPRPFHIDPSVAVVSEEGFGFPSGHAQQAALFWGLAIYYLQRWWVTVLATLFVALVGLSRIYLGVHYPTDIIGSLIIAALILYGHNAFGPYFDRIWKPSLRFFGFALTLVVAVCACIYVPSKDMISAAGLGVGFVGGLLFTKSIPPLAADIKHRFTVAALTAVVLLSVYVGFKLIFPAKGNENYEIFSFIRYFTCGVILNALPIFLQRFIPQPDLTKTEAHR